LITFTSCNDETSGRILILLGGLATVLIKYENLPPLIWNKAVICDTHAVRVGLIGVVAFRNTNEPVSDQLRRFLYFTRIGLKCFTCAMTNSITSIIIREFQVDVRNV
jgi:hypothetical protein